MEITDQLYHQCSGIINAMVAHYMNVCPMLDPQELKSEANLIFCQAASSFSPDRGAKFTTYLFSSLRKLSHIPRVQIKYAAEVTRIQCPESHETTEALDMVAAPEDTEDQDNVFSVYEKMLGPDAKEIVDLFFSNQLSAPETSHARKDTPLTAWTVYVRALKKKGWSWVRTQTAWADLCDVLSLYAHRRAMPLEA